MLITADPSLQLPYLIFYTLMERRVVDSTFWLLNPAAKNLCVLAFLNISSSFPETAALAPEVVVLTYIATINI